MALGKARMQDQAQESSLRVGVHGEIERRGGLNEAVDDTLHLSGRLLQDQEVGLAEENNSDRLCDPGIEYCADLEVRIQNLEGKGVCGPADREQCAGGKHEQQTFRRKSHWVYLTVQLLNCVKGTAGVFPAPQ
jgi:hypothetical protein